MTRAAATVPCLLPVAFAGGAIGQAPQPPSPEGWVLFEGSWSVSGQRQPVVTEGDRKASTVQVSGTVLLTSGAGLSKGFLGEADTFDDGSGVSIGRWVWTDRSADRIFSELRSVVTPQGSSANLLFAGSGYLTRWDLYWLRAITMAANPAMFLLVGTPWSMLVAR